MTADMSVAVETVVVMVVPSITSHILHPTTDHEFKADCQWWRDNLVWLNGEVPLTEPCATCIAYIDATGLGGIGVYVDGAFASLAPDSVRSQAAPGEVGYDHPCTETSTEWELFAFLVLLRWFGAALHGIVVGCTMITEMQCEQYSISTCQACTPSTKLGFCVKYSHCVCASACDCRHGG